MSSGRKSVHRPLPAEVEVVLDEFQHAAHSREQRLQLHLDEELNQLLARLKTKFAPQPSFLPVKLEPSDSPDPYLAALQANSAPTEAEPDGMLDSPEAVAAIVEIESSANVLPTLNSTINRLANYLSDKHGKDIAHPVGSFSANKRDRFQLLKQAQMYLPPQVQLRDMIKSDGLDDEDDEPPQEAFALHPQHVSVAAVKARLLSVDKEKRFSCYVCQRRFHLFAHLRNHLDTHTGEKPHECPQCGKCFATVTSLKRHVPIHHSDKKHQCGVCGKAYANQGYLKVHMRIHRDEKPFDCELCGRAFRQLAHLNHHLLTHTGDKPHKCDLCGQRFRQANTLEDHMRLHTGERPHCCSMCGKSFTHRLSLKLHMKYHSEASINIDSKMPIKRQQHQQRPSMSSLQPSDEGVEVIT